MPPDAEAWLAYTKTSVRACSRKDAVKSSSALAFGVRSTRGKRQGLPVSPAVARARRADVRHTAQALASPVIVGGDSDAGVEVESFVLDGAAFAVGFRIGARGLPRSVDPVGILCERAQRSSLRGDRRARLDRREECGVVRARLDRRSLDLDPLSLLTRLCASVPPPRFHTTRYAGVLASVSKLRSRILPKLDEVPSAAESSAPDQGPEPVRAPRSLSPVG